jgi:hypothetical protein
MIITLMNGNMQRTTIRNCTGYVAKRIELEARDCTSLLSMLEHDPEHLKSVLVQLGARFPESRAPALRPYQEDVVERGTLTGRWDAMMDGRACGKTRTMEEIRAQYEKAGYKIYEWKRPVKNKWDATQLAAYRAMFPKIADEWTHIREPAPPKQWSLLRWFLFWFTLFFLAL